MWEEGTWSGTRVTRLSVLLVLLLELAMDAAVAGEPGPPTRPQPRVEYPWNPDQRDGTYRNPILCADYSDPDVLRDGEPLVVALGGGVTGDLARSKLMYFGGLIVLTQGTAHAYLKVSEGCSNPCTFCAIPQMRGKFRSRSIEGIVREAQALQQSGVKELNLVAQDTTRYGEDIGIGSGLTKLLHRLRHLAAHHALEFGDGAFHHACESGHPGRPRCA